MGESAQNSRALALRRKGNSRVARRGQTNDQPVAGKHADARHELIRLMKTLMRMLMRQTTKDYDSFTDSFFELTNVCQTLIGHAGLVWPERGKASPRKR